MSREIKFRAWTGTKMVYPEGPKYVLQFGGIAGCYNVNQYDTVDWPIMQFTGLKDKDGKEIYEHDNIRILYTDWPSNTDSNISLEDYKNSISKYGRVVWDFEQACWVVSIYSEKYAEYLHSSIHPGTHGEIEVIGNKYQTP